MQGHCSRLEGSERDVGRPTDQPHHNCQKQIYNDDVHILHSTVVPPPAAATSSRGPETRTRGGINRAEADGASGSVGPRNKEAPQPHARSTFFSLFFVFPLFAASSSDDDDDRDRPLQLFAAARRLHHVVGERPRIARHDKKNAASSSTSGRKGVRFNLTPLQHKVMSELEPCLASETGPSLRGQPFFRVYRL